MCLYVRGRLNGSLLCNKGRAQYKEVENSKMKNVANTYENKNRVRDSCYWDVTDLTIVFRISSDSFRYLLNSGDLWNALWYVCVFTVTFK